MNIEEDDSFRNYLNNDLIPTVMETLAESPFNGRISYTVNGGMCTVSVWNITCESARRGWEVLTKNLPISALCIGSFCENAPGSAQTGVFIYIDAGTNCLNCHTDEGVIDFFGSITYPIKK